VCMIYNRQGKPSYIRLCYRTGRRGERVPYTAENERDLVGATHDRRARHRHGQPPDAGPKRRRGGTHLITFDVPAGTPAREVERVAGLLDATRHTYNEGRASAAFFWERALRDAGHVLDRAAEFGWRGVPAL
jgi:hypothetical protein